ncbi:MAG TPA: A/G-specific adenine glycosylase [Alphaproteobacteria bacterium]|nr:A/G-specific adenine glycosylase [Alphaproteobacteria bacterium]
MPRRKRADASRLQVDAKLRRAFQTRLLTWYAENKRDLPWRKTSDPYSILVSEIMLQQTQVDRVIPKYEEFLRKYPTLEALAKAPVDEVKRTWYPLGYNIRPIRLHSIAREAVEKYGGKIPDDPDTLQSLKGIGRYTAGAVLSFAYGRAAPILDTNVRRVLHRVFIGQGDARGHRVQRELWELSEALIPAGKAYDFNQALMDFGATMCTARKPLCLICPMQQTCKAYPCTP